MKFRAKRFSHAHKPLDRPVVLARRRNLLAAGAVVAIGSIPALAGEASEEAAAGEGWMSDEDWLDQMVLGDDAGWEDDAALIAALGEDDTEGEGESSSAARELEAAIKSLVRPTYDGTLEVSGGWKSNALLSEDGSVDSSFQQASVDLFGMRPELGNRWELLGIFFGEYRRYDSVPDLDSEYLAVGRGQAARSFGDRYRAFAYLEGVASKQAFDAGLVDFETVTQTVTYRSPEVGAGLERSWGPSGKLSVEAALSQSSFDVSSEDYGRAKLELGYSRALGAERQVQFGFTSYWEDYDERRSRLATGALTGAPLLEVNGMRFEGEYRLTPDTGPLKLLRSKLVYEREDDQAGNYYERSRWELAQSARWAWEDWQLDGSAAYGTIDYAARLAGPSGDATRGDRSWRLLAQLSRQLPRDLRAFLEFEYVDKDSNTAEYSYRSETVRLGLSWAALNQD